jgi:hypothetical protein
MEDTRDTLGSYLAAYRRTFVGACLALAAVAGLTRIPKDLAAAPDFGPVPGGGALVTIIAYAIGLLVILIMTPLLATSWAVLFALLQIEAIQSREASRWSGQEGPEGEEAQAEGGSLAGYSAAWCAVLGLALTAGALARFVNGVTVALTVGVTAVAALAGYRFGRFWSGRPPQARAALRVNPGAAAAIGAAAGWTIGLYGLILFQSAAHQRDGNLSDSPDMLLGILLGVPLALIGALVGRQALAGRTKRAWAASGAGPIPLVPAVAIACLLAASLIVGLGMPR